MKPIIPFALLGALLAVGAADAVATKPVGYTSATIYGAFGPSSPKTNVVAPDLQNSASWAGTVASVAGDTITLTSAALTPNAYNQISASFSFGTVYAYFIETADGYWAQIVSNDATSVTVEAGAGSQFTNGEAVTIHRHITISDYFGAANETGLTADAGGDPGAADNIILIDEVNSSSILVFAAPGLLGPTSTWTTDGFEEAGSIPIYPDQGLQVVRRGLGNVTVVLDGEVDTNGRQIQVTSGIQIRPYVIPVATTLGALNLHTGNDATGLGNDAGSVDIGQADTVQVLVDGVTNTYFYSTVDLGSGAGWYDDGFVAAPALPAGAGLIVNRNNPRNASPFVWVNPAPTIAP
jgi:hypothetical protein